MFECSVIVDEHLSDQFSVESGGRQGCIISPILFLVASLIGSCAGQWLMSGRSGQLTSWKMTLLLSPQHVSTHFIRTVSMNRD